MIKKVIVTPFQKFVSIESLGGILLLVATIVALVWANSPFASTYTALWDYKLGITTEGFELYKPLMLWINDGLMAIFFFLIGLEIKRELLIGELNTFKKTAFPLVGALGGMLAPILFYLVLNKNPTASNGWGIPMATDIAFSLAVLQVLGKRVPLSLKVFLTAFAIVDDIGAVLVIAVFYSGDIAMNYLLLGVGLLALLYFMSYQGYYSRFVLVSLGALIWTFFLKSGIHPTVAGILLAFAVPIRQKIDTPKFLETLNEITDKIKAATRLKDPILSNSQIYQVDDLQEWVSKYQSPLQHLEHALHGWVAYLIIPIFALANAGVQIFSDVPLDMDLIGIMIICLIAGNSIGVTSLVLLFNKFKLIEIPSDISFKQIVGVAFLAGVGFTMAIFIASLAFEDSPELIDSAKVGILIGSLLSAAVGYTILRFGSEKAD
ncbi:sodium/proton antiporter, NhaA family [Spirosomataceae bacterium TFI 002]|nr:sodium/proton antiporter, NhaA family [Spirosomataceae bacterium TFI 002]